MAARGVLQFVGDPEVMKRDFHSLLREGMEENMEFWHRKRLPFHFTNRASAVYGYKRRSAKHNKRKLRRFGHTRPLEFTGRMKQQVTSRITITSTKRGKTVRGALQGPRYLFAFRKDFGQADKAAELTAVTQPEVLTMARRLDKFMTNRLNNLKEKREIRV